MSDQSRTDTGHYAETITLERVLRVFGQIEGPTITSRDVADVLDCSTEAARQKLGQLHEQGRIHRCKSGRTVLWWQADDAQAATEFDPDGPLFAEPHRSQAMSQQMLQTSMNTSMGQSKRILTTNNADKYINRRGCSFSLC